jgi:hypothetical protein
MKRLLLGPALIAPLALFGCSNWGTSVKAPELPKVPDVIRQIPLEDFNTRYPGLKQVPAAEFEKANPTPAVKKTVPPYWQCNGKPATNHKNCPKDHAPRPVPKARPHVDQAPVETLPPQQGPICIFPLNMIPNCTPQRT